MTMHGANPDELDQLARSFASASAVLANAQRSLTGQLTAAPWHGQKASRFRSDWSRAHRPALVNATAFLRDAGTALQRQAHEQRAASGVLSPGLRGPRPASARLPVQWFTLGTAGGTALGVLLARGWQGLNTAAGGVAQGKFVIETMRRARVLRNITASASKVFRVDSSVLKAAAPLRSLGTILTALSVADDSSSLTRAIATGNSDLAIRKGISLAWTGTGVAIPVVGWAKSSWDVGYAGGTALSSLQQRVFKTEDRTVEYAAKTYGTRDIGTRYDGFSGFGNWVADSFRIKNPFSRK